MELIMLKHLIKLANELDKRRLVKEADHLDGIIKKIANSNEFESLEDFLPPNTPCIRLNEIIGGGPQEFPEGTVSEESLVDVIREKWPDLNNLQGIYCAGGDGHYEKIIYRTQLYDNLRMVNEDIVLIESGTRQRYEDETGNDRLLDMKEARELWLSELAKPENQAWTAGDLSGTPDWIVEQAERWQEDE